MGRVSQLVSEGYSVEDAYSIVREEVEFFVPLNEKIEKIINNGSIEIEELKNKLNDYKYISIKVTEKEIIEEVLNYPSLFHYLDGLVISSNDNNFAKINKSVFILEDLVNNVRLPNQLFHRENILFYYLLFFKRLVDINKDKLNIDIDLIGYNSHIIEDLDQNTFLSILYSHLRELQELTHYDRELIHDFFNILEQMKVNVLYEIFHILRTFDTSMYNALKFGKIFERFIKRSFSKLKGEHFSNNSLHRLIVKLLDIGSDSFILDPFGGSGGLLLEALNKHNNSIASYIEINQKVTQIAYMNFILHDLEKRIHVFNQDCLDTYDNGQYYDYILTEPPLGVRLKSEEFYFFQHILLNEGINPGSKRDPLSLYIIFILSKLKENGKAIILVPSNFTFKLNDETRKYLIENDYIESVINLPSNILPHTAIKTSLILFNKKKKENLRNKIKFINASLIIKAKGQQESIIDIENVLDDYYNETKNSILVDKNRIIQNDYHLNSNLYKEEWIELQNLLKIDKAKYLKELVSIQIGRAINKEINLDNKIGIPFIKVKNLKSDVLDLFLLKTDDFERINEEVIDSLTKIENECILIARTGNQLKPTIFRPTNEIPCIYIDQNVYALTAKENIISIEYLYYQLYDKLLLEQIKAYSEGRLFIILNISSLKKLIIPYMPLNLQQEYIAIQKSSLIIQEKEQLEAKLNLIGYQEQLKEKESDIVKILVHQLRATLLTISMEAEIIKEIITINNVGDLTNVNNSLDDDFDNDFDETSNYTLAEISDKLYKDTKKLSDSLTNVNKVMDFKLTKSDFTRNNICDFFKEYIISKKMEINSKYELKLKCEDIDVEFNISSFIELLDQLLLNAEKHAFIGNAKFYINFNIKADKRKNLLIIDYINNGKRFNISKKEYIGAFVKGQSSQGSGIGGNYIYRIVKAHNGDLFIQENDEGFHLKIEIPLNQN